MSDSSVTDRDSLVNLAESLRELRAIAAQTNERNEYDE